jgi:hypothetical protein
VFSKSTIPKAERRGNCIPLNFVVVGDFDAKSYKLNFRGAFSKCVQVEFVLVETVLVGDPL